MTRTGSIASCVPPALTTIRRPARSPFRPKAAAIWPTSSAGSNSRPIPVSPDASRPGAGPASNTPRCRKLARFSCVAGWSYILASIAGATSSGASVAITVVVSGSSASPAASFAMQCTVAGAITTMSAQRANATCSTLYSAPASKVSVTTLRCVRLRKASGVTNCVAP